MSEANQVWGANITYSVKLLFQYHGGLDMLAAVQDIFAIVGSSIMLTCVALIVGFVIEQGIG